MLSQATAFVVAALDQDGSNDGQYDVWMVQGRRGLCLLYKPPHPIVIGGDFGGQNFERYFAIQLRVPHQILHLAHSAFTNLRADFVTAEFCASGNRHLIEAVQAI